MVGAPGFEPGTSCAQGRRATRLRYAPTEAAESLEKSVETIDSAHVPRHPHLPISKSDFPAAPPFSRTYPRKRTQKRSHSGIVPSLRSSWVSRPKREHVEATKRTIVIWRKLVSPWRAFLLVGISPDHPAIEGERNLVGN